MSKIVVIENTDFDETIKREAYSTAMKLKRAGLDNEIIYARLEKQNIPEQLIAEIIKNISIEKKKKVEHEAKVNYRFAAIQIGIGFLIAILSGILIPEYTILPIGFIACGIITAVLTSKMKDD